MKLEKNKIVFAFVLLCIILFIGAYTVLVFDDDEATVIENNQIPVPKLKDEQDVYESKLDALNDLKEVRQTNAPSIYDERLLDSAGVYDPDLLDKEKMRIVDSIYNEGRIRYTYRSFNDPNNSNSKGRLKERDSIPIIKKIEAVIDPKALGLEHQLFFASNPQGNPDLINKNTNETIYVRLMAPKQ